ncbi:MAG: TetR/AcrR family transcriptional regulator [Microthrixaceae bacterium]
MSSRSERPDDSEATRDRLIDVTIRLLDERGNHALRLADVARESGVAVSTIYAHFRDRTDLVAAARVVQFRSHSAGALDRVADAIEPSLTSAAFVESAMWPSLLDPDDPDARTRRWDRIEAIADSRHIPELAGQLHDLQSALNKQVIELVRRGQDLGVVDPAIDASSIAMLSQVLRLGLALWDISGDTRPETEAWARTVNHVFSSILPDGVPEQTPGP